MREGMRRVRGSRRFVFQPETRSNPSSSFGEEARDLGRIVLKVAVDRDDDVALRLRETRLECGRLAEVAPEPNDANVVVRSVQARERGERAVGRAVVDENDLPRLIELPEGRGKLVVQEGDTALLVVYRDDHRDHAR